MTTFPLPGRPVRIGVLALQGDVREHIRTVEALGGTAAPIRRPSELADIDGLIIPGGESTTMDKLTRAFGLAEPLKERIIGGLPVYGSCAGMILLADTLADPATDRAGLPQQTLGGIDMVVRRNAFGRQRESFETDLAFSGLASADGGLTRTDGGGTASVHAVFIRAPWVEKVGESVDVLAQIAAADTPRPGPRTGSTRAGGTSADSAGGGLARIVAVRAGKLLATSFHPEVTGEQRIHQLFIQIIRGEA